MATSPVMPGGQTNVGWINFDPTVFGGKYDPAYLRFPINLLAGKEPASDLRDWNAIRAWAADLKPILAA